MASLYRRGKVWWIQYRIGGKNVQRSLDTESEQLAKLKLKQVEGLHVSGELGLPKHTPVQPFLEFFCDHLQQRRSKTSYRADISYLRNFFGPLCKALKTKAQIEAEKKGAKTDEAESIPATSMSACRPEDVTPGLVNHSSSERVQTDGISPKTADRRAAEKNDANVSKAVPIPASSMPVRYLEDVTPELVNHFISERIRTDGISPKTANRTRELLHVMFSYAIKHHGFVSPIRGTRNPMENVDRRPEPAPKIRFLELEEIAKQLKLLKKQPVLRTAVAILIYAGLRREECLWLTKDDVDLAQRIIRVRAKTEGGEFWQPKTKRNRAVPISNALLAILKEYRPKKGCVWFVPSPEGKRWDPDNFSHALSDVNLKAGLNWGSLVFRHTFGSQLAMKGESLFKISELMGNSPEICRRHYAALIPEKMRDTVEFDVPADNKTEALRSHQIRKRRGARGRRAFAVVKANVG